MHVSDNDLMRRRLYFKNLKEDESFKEEEKPEKDSVTIGSFRRIVKVPTHV
jgi:hypothetical protein